MTLLAAVIALKPSRPLPAFLGRAAQAWFLDRIRQTDPALARALHGDSRNAGGQDRRPYTIRVMSPRMESQGASWLRLSSLSRDLTEHLDQVFLPALPSSFSLAGVEIEIRAV